MQQTVDEIRLSYNQWSEIYDTNVNRTRDLEGTAIREVLKGLQVGCSLEVGCGTGKNTLFLQHISSSHLAVDLSEAMLQQAISKVNAEHVHFLQADITLEWDFLPGKFDLVVFSLVLEHIENLKDVFRKLGDFVSPQGHVYIGELHPFKQYAGSKARYEENGVVKELVTYTHHVSDFTEAAQDAGFELTGLKEYFDQDDRQTLPRILTLLFRKK